jgi:FkbM family methyltransferase
MASLCHGSRIHAFEPHIINNNQLKKNVELNGFKNLEPHLLVVGKDNGWTRFYMQSDVAGSSGSQLGSPVDEHGQEFIPSCDINIEQFTVDHLATMYDKPHHIKIDVDGHELDIMKGMDETIQDKTLKSILIECNKKCINIKTLIQKLEWHGFTLDNNFNRMENHSRVRRGGNPENLIFVRI